MSAASRSKKGKSHGDDFCSLCGTPGSSDGRLPGGEETVQSKITSWQKLGHIPDCRVIPEDATVCRLCVDVVTGTEDMDNQLDENFELLWSLLKADDEDDDVVEGLYEENEFGSAWENIEIHPNLVQNHPSARYPRPKQFLKPSKAKNVSRRRTANTFDDRCAICQDIAPVVANAAVWHFPHSGDVVVQKLHKWCLARRPEPCRRFRPPAVPMCQLCVELLLDTEEMEFKIIDNLVLMSSMLKEPPDANRGTHPMMINRNTRRPPATEPHNDGDIKPDVLMDLPLILVQTELDKDGEHEDVKPDLDELERDLKEEVEKPTLSAPLNESSESEPRNESPEDWNGPGRPKEEEQTTSASGRPRRRNTLARPIYSDELRDSSDDEVKKVSAKFKKEKQKPGPPKKRGRPRKSEALQQSPKKPKLERSAASGLAGLVDDDSNDSSSDDNGDEEGKVESLKYGKNKPPLRERIAGAEFWFKTSCRACDKTFPDLTALAKHFTESHPGMKPFMCHYCFLQFSNGDDFAIHVMMEELLKDGEGAFKCRECSESFPNPRFLSVHYGEKHWEDNEGGPFSCKECTLSFPTFSQFVEHRQKPIEEHVKAAAKHRIEWKCNWCGCQTDSHAEFARHRSMKHDVPKAFECPRCHLRYPTLKVLVKHLARAEFNPKRECDLCSLRFKNETIAVQHAKQVHAIHVKRDKPSVPSTCPYCGVQWKSRLKMHIARMHTKEKLHACKFCNESFMYERELLRHEVEVHKYKVERVRRPCPECGKIFKNSKAIARHRLHVHGVAPEGRRLYQCQYCERKFIDARKHKEHQDTHTGVKPHLCPHCDHRTVTFVNLKSHIQHRHRTVVTRVMRKYADPGDDLAYDIVELGPWVPPAPKPKIASTTEGGEEKSEEAPKQKRKRRTKKEMEEARAKLNNSDGLLNPEEGMDGVAGPSPWDAPSASGRKSAKGAGAKKQSTTKALEDDDDDDLEDGGMDDSSGLDGERPTREDVLSVLSLQMPSPHPLQLTTHPSPQLPQSSSQLTPQDAPRNHSPVRPIPHNPFMAQNPMPSPSQNPNPFNHLLSSQNPLQLPGQSSHYFQQHPANLSHNPGPMGSQHAFPQPHNPPQHQQPPHLSHYSSYPAFPGQADRMNAMSQMQNQYYQYEHA